MAKIPLAPAITCLIAWPLLAAPGRPNPSTTLEPTRTFAANYIKQLPDFVCTETIHRYTQIAPRAWYPTDILSIRLTYALSVRLTYAVGGAVHVEDRRLIEFNGHAADQATESIGGLTNTGEFGGMFESLFDPATAAAFYREHSKAGRAVYSYHVEQSRSHYSLSADPAHTLTVAYRGAIEIDRQNGSILRLRYEAQDIPASFPIQRASTTIDYEYVDVAGKRYLLPSAAVTETGGHGQPARNVSRFADYRKFSIDSAISFSGEN